MPLVTINCKPGWRLHDVEGYTPRTETNPRLRAVYAMAQCLTVALAKAINNLDGIAQGELVPAQVFVNFANIHGAALNANDVQIVVVPDNPNPDAAGSHQEHRRVALEHLLRFALRRLIRAELSGYAWPKWDIEVLPIAMSGSTTAPDGTFVDGWGGVAAG